MTLHVLEIPEDPADLPNWLERQLVSLDLAAVVAELSAVHGPSPDGPSLHELLGDQQKTVLASGLGNVSSRLLGYLLLRPQLLLELQALILSEGGAYWDGVASDSPELRDRVKQGATRLDAYLGRKTSAAPDIRVHPSSLESPSATMHASDRPMARDRTAWYRAPWIVGLATAAAVLFGVMLYEQRNRPAPVATASAHWGWARTGALQANQSRDQYLESLASLAGEWFDRRPDTPAALAQRIGEFRQACSVLLLTEHTPLPRDDSDWLKERCRQWASKLDGHLAAIESGEDVQAVRDAADETIRKLMEALRARKTMEMA